MKRGKLPFRLSYIRRKRTKTWSGLTAKQYRKYLRSEHWKKTRYAFFASKYFTGSCYICSRKRRTYNVHHKTYIRLGEERLSDFHALCGTCHKELHTRLKTPHSRMTLWNAANILRHRYR